MTRRIEVALWLLLAAAVLLTGLGRNPVLSSHESRVVDTASAMAHSGWPWNAVPVAVPKVELQQTAEGSHFGPRKDGGALSVNPWLVPVFEGEIRLQKPPLPYWIDATLIRLFGEGAGIARVPTAMLGVISCALIYQLARRVAGRRVAIVALALAVSSHFLVDEYRKTMADPYLACLTLAAIVAWIEASTAGRSALRARLIVAFYLMLGLASLAKGPVAFLHVGLAIGAYSFAFRLRPQANWLAHLVGFAVYLAIAVPWPVYIITHLPSALEIWRFESVGEFSDNLRNARPFYFYLPNLLLVAAPWSGLWLAGGVDFFRRRSRRRSFAWVWLIATVLVFSCSHMKKNAYLLPVVPAIVVVTAIGIVRMLAIARLRRRDPALGWTAVAHWVGGLAVAGMIAAMSFKYFGGVLSSAITLASVLFAMLPLQSLLQRDFDRWFKLQAVAFSLLIGVFLAFPESAARARKKSTDDASRATHLSVELARGDDHPQAGDPSATVD